MNDLTLSFSSFFRYSVKILLSEEPLPGSTERSMTLSGTNQGIHEAVLIALRQLASVCTPISSVFLHLNLDLKFYFMQTPEKGQPVPYRPSGRPPLGSYASQGSYQGPPPPFSSQYEVPISLFSFFLSSLLLLFLIIIL